MSAENAPEYRLTWEYLAHSEVGLVRKNNQDSGLVSDDLLMVADGMGGAAAGDLASAVAVDTLAAVRLTEPDSNAEPGSDSPDAPAEGSPGGDKLHRLAAAISAANTRISDLVSTDYSLEGMGTTVTAAVLDGDGIGLAHIGDSRGYLFRDGQLQQLTHDHSWVQSLIDEGKISEEEAAAHPHRSLLLKVLNGQPSNEPDLSTVPLRPGDRLLICSDGLCGFVDDDAIAAALGGTSRREAMDELVDAAHAAGGLDNITIIIADLVEAGADDLDATATREPIAGRRGSETPAAGSVPAQEADGPIGEQQVLGAAAEHDVAAEEEQIRQRAALRAADQDDDDDDFVDDDHEDDDGLEDEDRYAPQPPSKRRWRRPLLLGLVALLVLAIASAAGFAWTRTQYYVGASGEDVAIFQGMNESVPGIPLSRVYEVQQLSLNDLPPYYQGLVRAGIETGTLDSARATVQQLKETAQRCAATPPATSPSPSPTSTATRHPRPSPSSSAGDKKPKKPSPTTKATRSPTHSPAATPTPTSPGQLPDDGKC
jgi:PPM family protein phosphatase